LQQDSEECEWPFTLFHTNNQEIEDLARIESGIYQAATDFVVATTPSVPDGVQRQEIVTAAVQGIWEARAARSEKRDFLRERLARFGDTKCQDLRLIIGAGPKEMLRSTDTGKWIATDVNTLDLVDWADWETILSAQQDRKFRLHRLLAEHVLEHLSLSDAHTALCNVARALGGQKTENGGATTSSIRIAVPDAGAGVLANSFAADMRDYHRLRLDAVAICELLDSAGLEGFLIEWHHSASAANTIEKAFSTSRDFVTSKEGLSKHTLSRVYRWTHAEIDDHGNISRSARG
jgi:hypothetical protein